MIRRWRPPLSALFCTYCRFAVLHDYRKTSMNTTGCWTWAASKSSSFQSSSFWVHYTLKWSGNTLKKNSIENILNTKVDRKHIEQNFQRSFCCLNGFFFRWSCIGGPGAGKASLCYQFRAHYGISYLSVGSLLRHEASEPTVRGHEMAKYVHQLPCQKVPLVSDYTNMLNYIQQVTVSTMSSEMEGQWSKIIPC